MESAELLKPRFEVLAEYPNCDFKTGEILLPVKHSTYEWYHSDVNSDVCGLWLSDLEKYPHLFRKLNWWERRNKEDMPKRVISKAFQNDTEVYEIEEWDMDLLVGWVNKQERSCCSLLSFAPEYGYFPAD